MHELPFTQSLLDLVTSHADRAGGGRVTGVHLVVGELSGIAPECVSLYWETVSEGTCAEGAALHVRHVPVAFTCLVCRRAFGREGMAYVCPHCGSLEVRVTAGSEQHLEAIDLECEAATPGAPRS